MEQILKLNQAEAGQKWQRDSFLKLNQAEVPAKVEGLNFKLNQGEMANNGREAVFETDLGKQRPARKGNRAV